MRSRNLLKVSAAAMAALMLTTVSACGSKLKTDVLKQIETDCGVQSERGKKLMYIYGTSVGTDWNEAQCVTNHMPDSVYEQLEKDEQRAKSYSETHNNEPLKGDMNVDGYSWKWTILRGYDTAETHLFIEKL